MKNHHFPPEQAATEMSQELQAFFIAKAARMPLASDEASFRFIATQGGLWISLIVAGLIGWDKRHGITLTDYGQQVLAVVQRKAKIQAVVDQFFAQQQRVVAAEVQRQLDLAAAQLSAETASLAAQSGIDEEQK